MLLQAHKNCQNMTEIEAKVSYVKLARSLKTYGVSFFLVKVRKIAFEAIGENTYFKSHENKFTKKVLSPLTGENEG